jgi:hypothetical protein
MAIPRDIELAFLANAPVVWEGLPGIGKTKSLEALFHERKVVSYTLALANREPSDIGGLPMPADDGETFILRAAHFAKLLVDAGKAGHRTALFMDEGNQAPPAVQSSAMRVVDEGVVGDIRLPEDCWRVMAVNPTDVATNGFDLAPALANRLVHLKFELDKDSWLMNFPSYWGNPPVKKLIPENKWMPQRGNVAAFLYTRKTKILDFPKEAQFQCGPWPSPRSWEKVSQLLAVANSPEDASGAIGGAVGQGLAIEFVSFMRNLDLPDPEKILADPSSFKMDKYKGRGDQVFAILSNLHATITSKLDEKRYNAFWEVLGKVAEAGVMDIGAAWARSSSKMYQTGWKVPAAVNKYSKILQEIGIQNGR